MATPALVVGIISFFIGLTGPIALGLGIGALRKINEEPTRYTGKGLAIAGLVMGAITTIFMILWLLFFVLAFSGM